MSAIKESFSFQPTSAAPPSIMGDRTFSNKNVVIIVLCVLLVLSFLGINVLLLFGNLIQSIVGVIGPLFSQILGIFGYTAGSIIVKTADVVSDTAITGIQIAEGTVNSVGNLLKGTSAPDVNMNAQVSLTNALNGTGASSTASSPAVAAFGGGWCLVGQYQGVNGCIAVGPQDTCMSGQVFPNQQMCLNPTMTSNMQPGQVPAPSQVPGQMPIQVPGPGPTTMYGYVQGPYPGLGPGLGPGYAPTY
jgi:hypothetical protein